MAENWMHGWSSMLIYALTVLVSSFLLFLVQPIIAKQILPWFGGSAAVWTTCLAFFQLVLLAGYAYSDLIQRYRPKVQSVLHGTLLVLSLAALPILAGEHWKPMGDEDPFFRILGLLVVTIGLPYFMLSTTGPLVQAWFAREQQNPAVAQQAYRLFALSNFASLLGLLAYPFLIEAWITTDLQALGWSGFYLLFVAAGVAVSIRAYKKMAADVSNATQQKPPQAISKKSSAGSAITQADSEIQQRNAAAPAAADYLAWFVLAALATLMLLSVSNHITQNVASIPFLWVVPLSLYLLTFVVAFEGRRGQGWYLRDSLMLPALVAAAFMAWGLVTDNGVLDIDIAIPMYLVGLFLVCLFCHGELAQAKPQARYLTRFYFMVALGGAAGGLFVAFVAPRVFPFYWELMLGVLITGLVGVWIGLTRAQRPLKTLFVGGSLISVVVCGYYAWSFYQDTSIDNIYASRNFYGTLRVKERVYPGGQEPVRRMVHGVILHGLQDLNAPKAPTSYYGRSSGVGLAVSELGKASPAGIRVAVVGLGVGTLATYGRKGDTYRMYEINPEVIELAQSHFTYLKDSAAKIEYALGDARLVLERETPMQFDLMVIDAFSSDSIPVHLMTRQALQAYLKHLKPNGVIAFHVTNRYLDLAPVIDLLAKEIGMEAAWVADDPKEDKHNLLAVSDWVLVTRNQALLNAPDILNKRYVIDPIPGLSAWTDDFNNLFRVLK